MNAFNWRDSAGGGGKDCESAARAVEALLHLSFYFDSDETLVSEYMKPELGLPSLLHDILNRPPVEIDSDTKTNLALLLQRLSAEPSKAKNLKEAPASTAAAAVDESDRHIMISYAWGAKKELVIELSAALRQQGYEVWRDEEGSAFVPSMSGDVQDRMVAVIYFFGFCELEM